MGDKYMGSVNTSYLRSGWRQETLGVGNHRKYYTEKNRLRQNVQWINMSLHIVFSPPSMPLPVPYTLNISVAAVLQMNLVSSASLTSLSFIFLSYKMGKIVMFIF